MLLSPGNLSTVTEHLSAFFRVWLEQIVGEDSGMMQADLNGRAENVGEGATRRSTDMGRSCFSCYLQGLPVRRAPNSTKKRLKGRH